MQYPIVDERTKIGAFSEFHFKDKENIGCRMANFKSAVNQYFDFSKKITVKAHLNKILSWNKTCFLFRSHRNLLRCALFII